MLNYLRFVFAWFITDRSTAKIEHTPIDSTHYYAAKSVIHKRYGTGTIICIRHCRSETYALVNFNNISLHVRLNTLKPW